MTLGNPFKMKDETVLIDGIDHQNAVANGS